MEIIIQPDAEAATALATRFTVATLPHFGADETGLAEGDDVQPR
jgi:hypothetical protein